MSDGMIHNSPLRALVEDLERDPIFAMSQGSKELFHSNLLGWYLSRFPPVAEALMGTASPVRVFREKHHTDLMVRAVGHPTLVIENKVFALPDTDQLTRIAAKLKDSAPRLVLLSLTDPDWPAGSWSTPDGQQWTWLGYQELAERLRPTIPAVAADDSYAGATLGRWLDLTAKLCTLVETVGRPPLNELLTLDKEPRTLLDRVRLDAPVQKMRFQQVATELAAHGVTAGVTLTNNTGLIDWFTKGPDGLTWGWQLQGHQFRLAIIVPEGHAGHGRRDEHQAAREAEAARRASFFNFDALVDLGLAASAKPTKFLRYNPNFVYQYIAVPGITVGQAVQLGLYYTQLLTRQPPTLD
ncbi:PDDEXK-like family protein [Streptacidiphilus sp. PAMC 29251]